jgi:Ca2+-binding RTX toxin-like protein
MAGVAMAAALAFPGIASAAVTSSVANGALNVSSNADDGIAITCDAGSVKVNGDNPGSGAANCAAITSIIVTGGPDDNEIDLTGVTAAAFPALASVLVNGGAGDDAAETGAGNDLVRGDAGADTLDAGADIDEVDAGDGDDVARGGTGRDTLRGGPGDDKLDGGGGDTFRFDDAPFWDAVQGQFPDKLEGGPGSDTLNGGGGDFDTVTYDGRQAPVFISLDGLRNDGERGERDLIGTDVEQLVGGEGDDAVRGSANGNFLNGGGGDDTVDAGGGFHDVAYGNGGNDTIITLDGGAEGRLGAPSPMAPSWLWDDAVRCDDNPNARGVDTAIVDPADGGESSQLAAGGCETILMTEAPQSVPVDENTVEVPVTCGSAPDPNATCTGTAVVEQYLLAKRGQASKKRVVGKRSFRAKVRRKSRLRVKLNSTGRKAAQGKRRLPAVRVAYRLKPKKR